MNIFFQIKARLPLPPQGARLELFNYFALFQAEFENSENPVLKFLKFMNLIFSSDLVKFSKFSLYSNFCRATLNFWSDFPKVRR